MENFFLKIYINKLQELQSHICQVPKVLRGFGLLSKIWREFGNLHFAIAFSHTEVK